VAPEFFPHHPAIEVFGRIYNPVHDITLMEYEGVKAIGSHKIKGPLYMSAVPHGTGMHFQSDYVKLSHNKASS
jgi:hypothetical protein